MENIENDIEIKTEVEQSRVLDPQVAQSTQINQLKCSQKQEVQQSNQNLESKESEDQKRGRLSTEIKQMQNLLLELAESALQETATAGKTESEYVLTVKKNTSEPGSVSPSSVTPLLSLILSTDQLPEDQIPVVVFEVRKKEHTNPSVISILLDNDNPIILRPEFDLLREIKKRRQKADHGASGNTLSNLSAGSEEITEVDVQDSASDTVSSELSVTKEDTLSDLGLKSLSSQDETKTVSQVIKKDKANGFAFMLEETSRTVFDPTSKYADYITMKGMEVSVICQLYADLLRLTVQEFNTQLNDPVKREMLEELKAEKQRKELAKAKQELQNIWLMLFSRVLPANMAYDLTDQNSVLDILMKYGEELKFDRQAESMLESRILRAYLPIFQNSQSTRIDKILAKTELNALYDIASQRQGKNFFNRYDVARSIITQIYTPILKDPQSSEDAESLVRDGINELFVIAMDKNAWCSPSLSHDSRFFVCLLIQEVHIPVIRAQQNECLAFIYLDKLPGAILGDSSIDSMDKRYILLCLVQEFYGPVLRNPKHSTFGSQCIKRILGMVLKNQGIDSYNKQLFAQSVVEKVYAPILKDPQSSGSHKLFISKEIRKLLDMVLKSQLISSNSKQYFAPSIIAQAYVPILKDPQSSQSDKSFARKEIKKLSSVISKNQGISPHDRTNFTQSIIDQAYVPILKDPQSSQSDKSFIREEAIRILDMLRKLSITLVIKPYLITDMMGDYATALHNPTSQDSKKLLSKYGEGGIEAMDALMQKYPDFVEYYKWMYRTSSYASLEDHLADILANKPKTEKETLYKGESSVVGEEEPYEEPRPIALESNSVAKTTIGSMPGEASCKEGLSMEARSSLSSIIVDSKSAVSQSSRPTRAGVSR